MRRDWGYVGDPGSDSSSRNLCVLDLDVGGGSSDVADSWPPPLYRFANPGLFRIDGAVGGL